MKDYIDKGLEASLKKDLISSSIEEKRCLYQILGFSPHKDNGNCEICTYDEHNKNCINYYPITLLIVDIENE